MARLPLDHENDPATDPKILAILDQIAASGFPTLNVLRALANKPETLAGFMGLINAVYNNGTGTGFSSLTPKETELAYTTATVANDCHY
jgi:alkylhydroperoxidase family enzyme